MTRAVKGKHEKLEKLIQSTGGCGLEDTEQGWLSYGGRPLPGEGGAASSFTSCPDQLDSQAAPESGVEPMACSVLPNPPAVRRGGGNGWRLASCQAREVGQGLTFSLHVS